MTDERKIDRKTFLKEAPMVFLRAFTEGIREGRSPGKNISATPLRPPGAAVEEVFLELCCGTGACTEVCPVDAIRLCPREDDPERSAPVIVPNETACAVCDELACMMACPSGALTPVSREEIQIGRASVDSDRCFAWEGIDLGCDYCADRCPFGTDAISMEKNNRGRGPVVKEPCVGCGLCEFYCPADPAAIRVYALDSILHDSNR